MEKMISQSLGGGEQKVAEYIERIKRGEESKESAVKGLSPSFVTGIEAGLQQAVAPEEVQSARRAESGADIVPPQYSGMSAEAVDLIWTVPEYVDREKTASEKERKQRALDSLRQKESDQVALEEVKKRLGMKPGEQQTVSKEGKTNPLSELIASVSEGRSQAVLDLYKDLYARANEPEARQNLISGLFTDVYNKYRVAEYPTDPNEEQIWDTYLKSKNIGINNKKAEWMYRGIFPKGDEETVTRGSFNVRVTPELIDALDGMITNGKIKANYKFGEPNTTASPNERHDSISIYFLEQPSDGALKELSAIIQPYVRGDTLLGKKVSDGFYLSEIGSVDSGHVDALVSQLNAVDPALASAVKGYTSPKVTEKNKSLKMSEAQFYAIRDTARAFGYEISYDKDSGFQVSQVSAANERK